MKFPYHVFHNGVSYAPFEDVPIEETPVEMVEETPVEEIKEDKAPITEDTQSESPVKAVEYTKTEINRMKIDDLKETAKNNGIEGADEMSGAEIKKALIEKFGL